MFRQLNLIVAMDTKNGISCKGYIPWNIREDMNFFQDVTTRKFPMSKMNAVIMGKNTWKTLPDSHRGLKNRYNVIVSKSMKEQELYSDNKTNTPSFICSDVEKSLELCKRDDIGQIYVIGGKSIYEYFLKKPHILDNIYITKIIKDYKCDNKIDTQLINDIPNEFKVDSHYKTTVVDRNTNENMVASFTKFIRNDLSPFVNKEENAYIDLLKNVLDSGHFRQTRNSQTWSVFGKHLEFNLQNGFPLMTTKKVFMRGVFEELKFFLSGETDVKKLSDKGVKIWDGNTTRKFLDKNGLNHYEEFDLGPLYPFQFRHYGLEYKGKNVVYKGGFDQLKYCLDLINFDPMSRRIVMTAFNPIQAQQSVLYPCHSLVLQFYIEEDRTLSLACYNRSQDLFLGVVFNVASSALMTHMVCNVINNHPDNVNNPLYVSLKPGRLIMNLGDVHIYENHREPSIRQILREPYSFPKLEIKKKMSHITDIDYEDIELTDYVSYSSIKAVMTP